MKPQKKNKLYNNGFRPKERNNHKQYERIVEIATERKEGELPLKKETHSKWNFKIAYFF